MFQLKKANLSDCLLIKNIAEISFREAYKTILSPEQLEYMFHMMYDEENIIKQQTEEGHEYFLVYKGEEPCAYISIEKESDDMFHFQKVYALPDIQGAGVGRYMIEQGIAYIKTSHPLPFSVQLNVNRANPALGFYEHIGFKKVAERNHPIGNGFFMNDYIMQIDVE